MEGRHRPGQTERSHGMLVENAYGSKELFGKWFMTHHCLPQDATSHQVKKELQWGPIYLGLLSGGKNPHGHRSVRGYPKVHILQRVVASRDSDKKHDKEWTVLKVSSRPVVNIGAECPFNG